MTQTGSTRFDGDTWDLASSVGLTATMVAAAPGSRFATEGLLDINELNEEELRQRIQRQSERWKRHGFDLDMAGLVYFDDRTDARSYLAAHGWQTTTTSTTDLLAEHGLPPIDAKDAPFGEVLYVSAELIGA